MPQMKITISFLLLGVVQTVAALIAEGGGDQFVDYGFTGANLSLDGTATVTPAGLLQLTNGTLQLKGHAFHPTPLRFREGGGTGAVRSFSASFVFGILSAYPDMSAHGIVFVVSPTTDFSTALASQYLGLVNVTSNGDERNQIFAVELDTLQQDEFRDINDNHVGVDINSLISLNSSDAGYYVDDDGSFKNLSLISHEEMRVWVDYDAVSNWINVTLAPLSLTKPAKPLISAIYNLSSVLTDMAYIGFSSATGSFNSRHYVLGWSFAMDAPAPAIDITKLPKLPHEGPKARSKVLEIVLPIASAAVVFCLGIAVILLMRRRMKYSELREDWEVEFGPHRFPYKDLHRATEGFRNKNLLGVGGFGRVYKGVLPISDLEIAVKRVSHNSSQGVKEFIAEVVSLGRLQHRNLVRLLGYCRRKGELLLVYEYMSNGSLDKYLYDQDKWPTLSWPQRFKIIKDIASGLFYLHEEWEKVVVHRDIKASNVLLDSEMHGQLGDFGLARLYNHGTDPQSTHVVGTIGYLAPELARTSKATPLTDVFAFGTFILEVTCGRRPIFQDANGSQVMLVDWVLEHWRGGTLVDTVDANLYGDFIVSEACLVLELGLMCSHPFVNARPNMRQVLQYLSKERQQPSFDFARRKMLFLLHLLLIVSLGPNIDVSADDSQFAYSGFTGSNLTVDGTATITSDGLLQLTNGTAYLKGHAFHPAPLRLRDSSNDTVQSFSVTFVFGIVSIYSDFSAHGMTFFIAPSKDFAAALPAKYLGLTNVQNNGNASNHLFAVELDTIQSVEFKDINNNHVGIDINGLQSQRSYNAGYYDDRSGEFQNLKLISRQAMQVWVDYNGEKKQINVTLAPLRMTRPVRPLLSSTYDLSTVLTDQVYLGFSSATGRVNSRHCVLGWSFGFNRPAPAIDIAKLPNLPLAGPKPRSKVLDIVLPIVTATFVLCLGSVVVLVVRRRFRYAELREDWEVEFGPHRFSYKDLYHATDGFKDKHLLGEGGFGKVYKGVLRTSMLDVAVKRVSHESRQGMKEFVAEIASIGRIRHRNLVQLLGYCRRKGELLLVYDYMPNGSLDKYLYKDDGDKSKLSWAQRFHIIKGVASGLLYLHERWEKVVVHRDVKPSNVLLDRDMNGQLGDFGLARLYDHGTDSQTTHVVGTMGYLSPELMRTGKASPLTDVFAFGIFLLELTCGQKPIKENVQGGGGGGGVVLVDWVLQHWRNGSLMQTVDARLHGEYDVEEAGLVLKLGLLCSHPFANARPGMGQVMLYLDGVTPLPELTPTDLSFHVLAMMQNKEFDMSTTSYPDLVTSFGTISSLSGGR
ncbi:L-type lectin-domain containing receptor kinase IV.1 [Dichanthelium oligosanthes]|uniref:non-specific serine/threonine protein kinase n=1 Tax=Dichanthelium oligosanthes TaxID=888268 RepID=A0A1E5VTR6_9POAL|nr:L-type lectin-domain containing receptor kinase IV.1 [Dichanthelium oligosanthes]